jgi:hypothetical protein
VAPVLLLPDAGSPALRLPPDRERHAYSQRWCEGQQVEGALDHLGRFKSFTTRVSWKLGFRGPLWQKSSYDRVMDMERPFEEVVKYVLNNPVRKGLVGVWEEWAYSRIVDPWW